MRRLPASAATLVSLLVVAACSAGAGPSDTTVVTEGGISAEPAFVTRIEAAVAVDVSPGVGGPHIAWSSHDAVTVASVDLESGELVDARVVSNGLAPVHHPIERPAVLAHEDGSVDVAFISAQEGGGEVYLSRDGESPEPVSGPPRPETNLVHAELAPDGTRTLAWLEDSTLSVAHESGGDLVELEQVDSLTCDCCNPVPAHGDGGLLVAYRDFEDVDGGTARNVVATMSTDGGTSFEAPVAIADDDWLISGCPFSGPDVAIVDGGFVVAWMDARQSRYPDQDGASIWVDRSDTGEAFGPDLEVASDGLHRWPTMTLDDRGMLHLFWETGGPDGGLSYSSSADGGVTFSDPVLVVGRQINDDGAPVSPTAASQDGYLVLTWADSRAGYVAGWPLGS